jgi:hypothetical protein
MARDTSKVQVFSARDGAVNWRKRDGAGDIIAHDNTNFGTIHAALKAALQANPNVDRIEVILDDDGQGNFSLPGGGSDTDYPA